MKPVSGLGELCFLAGLPRFPDADPFAISFVCLLPATSGIDKITPFPVPTHRRSLASNKAVIRTNE